MQNAGKRHAHTSRQTLRWRYRHGVNYCQGTSLAGKRTISTTKLTIGDRIVKQRLRIRYLILIGIRAIVLDVMSSIMLPTCCIMPSIQVV
jgi:hypothetical protein